MNSPSSIKFYSVGDGYGEFSNFARYPFRLKGKVWPTVEHYFQAQKHAGTPMEEKIRTAPTPEVASQLGRDRRHKLPRAWESEKEQVMLEALRAKFTQHPDLGRLLLETENCKLIEHTANDCYWGDGGDGTGKNRLGLLLEQIRNELRTKP